MLKNYIRITLRNFKRNKGYSFINISGLATGLAAFVLIVLFVQNELSFDSVHEHSADVYRVVLDAEVADQSILTASSPAIMATQFLKTFPEILYATRINDFSSEALFTVGNEPYYESGVIEADSSIFDIFTFPLVQGDIASALNRPNTAVISQDIAHKYFGDENPIGRSIQYDNRRDYEVTGVMAEIPHNSHLRPSIILSFLTNSRANDTVWLNNSFLTYIRLAPGASSAALAAKFPDFLRTFVGPQIEQFVGQTYEEALKSGFKYDWKLEALSDIYLYSKAEDGVGKTGDVRYLYILSAIALFVLFIACINFMNLSTARATGRAREVGIRKTMGSDRSQLIRQFLGESTMMAAISMVLAFVIVLAFLPYFSKLADASLSIAPWLIAAMVGIALITGLVAGLYPALVLSSFEPAFVLKGTFSRSKHGTFIRSALVVFQFGISVVLLVGTGVVYKQLDFMQSQDLGFQKDHVVVLPIETQQGLRSFDTFRSRILSNPNVINTAAAGLIPGPNHVHNNTGFRSEGMSQDDFFIAAHGEVSNDYAETMGFTLVAGRDFDESFQTDSTAFVINEAAAKQMGLTPEEAIGHKLARLGGNPDDSDRWATVIGVVADANFNSLHSVVQPMVMGRWTDGQRYIPVRIGAENTEATIEYLKEAWMQWEPGYPFRYFFLDDDYQKYYEQEQRLGSIYGYFTVLAVLIACLGLFGLASFVTTQRTKEIGVRKVMGASVPRIVVLLSREFTILVLVACLIGFPVAWFMMNRWLQDFAYATTIGWQIFAISGVAALIIAWLTVSYQSIKAATCNPVKALRSE